MSHVTQLSESDYITNAMNMDFKVIMLMQSHSGQSPTSRLDNYAKDYGHGVPLWMARWYSKQQPSEHV